MKFITINKIYNNFNKYINKIININGWVKSIRNSKLLSFIILYDGTFLKTIQIICNNNINNFNKIKKLNTGAAIIINGQVISTPKAKQKFEIRAKKIVIEGESNKNYPLQKKHHSMEFLRNILHLRPRTNIFQAIFRIRSIISFSIHNFFKNNEFIYVHTPIITENDCENTCKMFNVTTLDIINIKKKNNYNKDFFKKNTKLTVSGQLNGEIFAQAFKNIYTFGPAFRAENSNTKRHAAEFWMVEPEMAFTNLDDCMNLAKSLLKYVIKYTLNNAKEEINFLNSYSDNKLLKRLIKIINSKFKCITYTKAIEILKTVNNFKNKISWGIDLKTEHERYLTEHIYNCPIFIINHPKNIKSFYMKQNDDNKTVSSMDCLVPEIGEIIGGGERENSYNKLKLRINELKLNKSNYNFYTDLRKYGSTHHSGFGLGFERLVMYITGIKNIRDVIPFPRTANNCNL